MNCEGDDDIDAKRSRPSIGKPVMGHREEERVVLVGTDQRITSGPAAKTAAFKRRIHGCTRTLRSYMSDSSCTAGAVHTCASCASCAGSCAGFQPPATTVSPR